TALILAIGFSAVILQVQGVYHDAPVLAGGDQLVNVAAGNPEPTFFIVRHGDELILTRDRTPIAPGLMLFLSGVSFLIFVAAYQSYRCLHPHEADAQKGVGYGHLLVGLFIAAFVSFMFLGAYPMIAVGERIVLDPAQDALIINDKQYASLHEITSFGLEEGGTGYRGNTRSLFVANRGPGKWVVLDALWFGRDVLSATGGAPSTADFLMQYMRGLHVKYPHAVHAPWPDYRQPMGY
ncbi:MAG TPA: hypothetical protein VGT42_02545, partial [Gammaproteobacteria bacterium]|nr:hypothetical protein [Gammaproteobacteria bacterium]